MRPKSGSRTKTCLIPSTAAHMSMAGRARSINSKNSSPDHERRNDGQDTGHHQLERADDPRCCRKHQILFRDSSVGKPSRSTWAAAATRSSRRANVPSRGMVTLPARGREHSRVVDELRHCRESRGIDCHGNVPSAARSARISPPLQMGRFAIIRDPQGGVFGLWQFS